MDVTRPVTWYAMILAGCIALSAVHPAYAQNSKPKPDTTVPPRPTPPRDTTVIPRSQPDTIRDTTSVRRPDTLAAVLPRPPRDTTRKDSVPPRADTVQARIGRDHTPPTLEIGETYTYTRDQLYSSGAATLTDLLSRMPGITTFQSGWIPAAQVAGYNGDLARIRVFYDGIEMDNLESRNGALLDLRNVQLWSLERLSITRGANEIRVDIRSWEYNKTRPYTRVDILTGDLNTNLYHAFYGKRFFNGAVLQVAGEQYGVNDPRNGGGGDQLSLFARYGVGKKNWSVDGTVLRTRAVRNVTQRYNGGQFMPNYQGTNTIAYIRAAIGREGDGPFAQIIASSLGLKENSARSTGASNGIPADSADSTSSLSQFVATVGFDRWGGRVRLFERYRTRQGSENHSFGGSFDFTHKLLGMSILAEHDGYYGYRRLEVGARFTPLNRIAISGYIGQRNSEEDRNGQVDSRSARIEGGVRLYGDAWLSAGVITRDTTLLFAPIVFDSAFRSIATGQTTGLTFAFRGPLKYGFSIDASTTTWNDRPAYTPKYQARAELRFATQWLSKFPNGNFSFLIAPYIEYRSSVAFPTATGARDAAGSRIYSLLAELRILRGTITYQRRNLALSIYEQVPGYLLPRTMNLYGIRWYFFD